MDRVSFSLKVAHPRHSSKGNTPSRGPSIRTATRRSRASSLAEPVRRSTDRTAAQRGGRPTGPSSGPNLAAGVGESLVSTHAPDFAREKGWGAHFLKTLKNGIVAEEKRWTLSGPARPSGPERQSPGGGKKVRTRGSLLRAWRSAAGSRRGRSCGGGREIVLPLVSARWPCGRRRTGSPSKDPRSGGESMTYVCMRECWNSWR